MIYTFKEILEMHGSLIYELRRNLPTNEKEIVDAVIQDELIDYVL